MNLSFKQFQDLLCKNGCGFMARPTLQGYCPKCWADKCLPSSSKDEESNDAEPNLSAMTTSPETNKTTVTTRISNDSGNTVNANSRRISEENRDKEGQARTVCRTEQNERSTTSGGKSSEDHCVADQRLTEKPVKSQNPGPVATPSKSVDKVGQKTSRDSSGLIGEPNAKTLSADEIRSTSIEDRNEVDPSNSAGVIDKQVSNEEMLVGHDAQDVNKPSSQSVSRETASSLSVSEVGSNNSPVACGSTREPQARLFVLEKDPLLTEKSETSRVPVDKDHTSAQTTGVNQSHLLQRNTVAQASHNREEKGADLEVAPSASPIMERKRSPSPDLEVLDVEKPEPELITIDDSEDVISSRPETASKPVNKLTLRRLESLNQPNLHEYSKSPQRLSNRHIHAYNRSQVPSSNRHHFNAQSQLSLPPSSQVASRLSDTLPQLSPVRNSQGMIPVTPVTVAKQTRPQIRQPITIRLQQNHSLLRGMSLLNNSIQQLAPSMQRQNQPSVMSQSRVVAASNNMIRFNPPMTVTAPPNVSPFSMPSGNNTFYLLTQQVVPQQTNRQQTGVSASSSPTTPQRTVQQTGQKTPPKSKSPRPIILSKSPVKVTKTVVTSQASRGTHVVLETHPVSSKGLSYGNTNVGSICASPMYTNVASLASTNPVYTTSINPLGSTHPNLVYTSTTHLASRNTNIASLGSTRLVPGNTNVATVGSTHPNPVYSSTTNLIPRNTNVATGGSIHPNPVYTNVVPLGSTRLAPGNTNVAPAGNTSLLQQQPLQHRTSGTTFPLTSLPKTSCSSTTNAIPSSSALWADWRKKIVGEKQSSSPSPDPKPDNSQPIIVNAKPSLVVAKARPSLIVGKQTSTIPKPPQPTRLLQMFPNSYRSKPTSVSIPSNVQQQASFTSLLQHFKNQVQNASVVQPASARGNRDRPPTQEVRLSTMIPKRTRPKKPVRRLNRRPIHKCQYCLKNFSSDVRHFRNHLWMHRQKYRPYWYEREEDNSDSKNRPQIGRRPFMLLYTPGYHRKIQPTTKSNKTVEKILNTEVCRYCDEVYEKGNELIVHENWHLKTMGNAFGHCSLCNINQSWSSSLQKHFQTLRHKTNLKAITAKAPSSAPKVPEHYKGPPYKCPHCSKTWPYLSKLLQHMKETHFQHMKKKTHVQHMKKKTSRVQMVSCDRCGTHFSNSYNLQRHNRVTQCGQKHKQKQQKQKKSVPQPKPTKSLKCVYCNAVFLQQSKLNAHQLMHTRDKLYSHICTTCGASFARAEMLATHKRVHAIETPYPCDHCSSRFTGSDDLKNHMLQKHPDVKPCVCVECSACFVNKSELAKHIQRAHKAEESSTEDETVGSFGCLYCSETFKDRNNLIVHQKTVHNPNITGEEEPVVINKVLAAAKPCHICLKCGKEFRNSKSLQSHMESHRINKSGASNIVASKTASSKTTSSKTTSSKTANSKTASSSNTASKHFKCKTCSKTLLTKSGYISHQRYHQRSTSIASEASPSDGQSTLASENELFSRSGVLKRILSSAGVSPISGDPHSSEALSVTVTASCESSVVDPTQEVLSEQTPGLSSGPVKESQRLTQSVEKARQPSKILKCKYCSRLFLTKANLNSHEKWHTEYRPYKCPHCRNRFKKKQHLLKHEKQHFPYLCRACGESSVTYKGFVNHVVSTHGELKERYICAMRAHRNHKPVNSKPEPSDRGHRCPYCPRRFCRETMRLRSHIKNHLACYRKFRHMNSSVKKSQISVSGNVIGDVLLKTLQTSTDDKHVREGDGKSNQKGMEEKSEEKQLIRSLYKCNDCDQSFTLWRLREEHIRRVHKNFTCQYCQKTFLVYQILMRHEKNHKKQGTATKLKEKASSSQPQKQNDKNCDVDSTSKRPDRTQEKQRTTAKLIEKLSISLQQGQTGKKCDEEPTSKTTKKNIEKQGTVTKQLEKLSSAQGMTTKQTEVVSSSLQQEQKDKECEKNSTVKRNEMNQEKQVVAAGQTKPSADPKQQEQARGDKKETESSLTNKSLNISSVKILTNTSLNISSVKIKQEPISDDSDSSSDSSSSYDSGAADDSSDIDYPDEPPKLRNEKEDESDEEPENNFKCKTCGRTFRRRLNLLQHARIHEAKPLPKDNSGSELEKEFKCKSCDRSFGRKGDLEKHMKMHEEKRYKCELCPRSFDKYLLLLRHNKRYHPGNKVIAPGSKGNQTFTCPVCFEHFADKEKMAEHKKLHSNDSKFVCQVCKTVFNQSWDLIVHKRSHTRDELRLGSTALTGANTPPQASADDTSVTNPSSNLDFKCSFCGFVCSDSSHLTLHEKTHTTPSKFTCTFCGKVFSDNEKLVGHLQNVHYAQRSDDEGDEDQLEHETDENMNKGKQKRKRGELDSESSDAASSSDAFDDLGGPDSNSDSDVEVLPRAKRYPRRASKRKYIQSSDDDDDDDRRNKLNKRYSMRAKSKKSYAEPSGIDPEPISSDDQTKKGEEAEQVDEPYKCSYCGIGFTLEEDWSFHEYQHAQNEPYRCQFCYRLFSRRSNLTQHERTHKGKKPYKCTDCGKHFAMDTHLRYHKKQEHSKQRILREQEKSKPEQEPYPYNCMHCEKGYYRRSDFVKHQDRCPEAKQSDSASKELDDSSPYLGERNAAKLARLQIAVNQTSSEDDVGFGDDDIGGDNDKESSNDIALKVVKEEVEVVHKCRFCIPARIYPSKKALMKHEVKAHRAKGPLKCEYCPRAFWYASEKKRHEKRHTKRKENPVESKASQITKSVPVFKHDDSLKCYLCNQSFSSKQLLNAHEQTHSEQQSHKCKFCLKTFPNEIDLNNHVKSHTAPEAPTSSFGCLFCHEMFTLKSALIDHIQTHSGRESYMCPHCDLTFPTSATLQAHEKEHFQPKTYQCSHCQALFNDKEKLKLHEASHKEDGYPCQYCGSHFIALKGLSSHIRSQHPDATASKTQGSFQSIPQNPTKQILQPVVRLQSLSKTSLYKPVSGKQPSQQEMRSQVETEVDPDDGVDAILNPYSCNVCKQSFPSPETLRKHVRTHSKEQCRKCQYCGKEFRLVGDLRKHLRLHLKSMQITDSSGTFKCQFCGIQFMHKSAMISHVKSHGKSKAKPFSFHKRNKAFGSKPKTKVKTAPVQTEDTETKQKSRKVNTGSLESRSVESNNATCKYCNRTFYNKYKMLSHIKAIHTKDRPHKCNECSYRFASEIQLTRHMIFHSGDTPKPHGCDVCGDRFAGMSGLSNHMRKHAASNVLKPTTFTCGICGKLFGQKRYLRKHEQLHLKKGEATQRQLSSSETSQTPPRKKKINTNKNQLNQNMVEQSSKDSSPMSGTSGHSPKVLKPEEGKLYECKYCSFLFLKLEDLVRHERTHPGEKPYSCEDCNKSFYKRSHLHVHRAKAHTLKGPSTSRENKGSSSQESSTPEAKPYSCVHCGKTFNESKYLRNHVRRMHIPAESQTSETKEISIQEEGRTPGEKMYRCDVCDRRFSAMMYLKQHYVKHKPKGSPVIKGVGSAKKQNLTKVREKLHFCDKCDKRYYTNSHLKEHYERVHKPKEPQLKDEQTSPMEEPNLENRLYSCEICDRSYYSDSHLKDHYALAHKLKELKTEKDQESSSKETTAKPKENKYKCDLCGRSYSNTGNLNRHYKEEHTQQKPQTGKEQERSPTEKPKPQQTQRQFSCTNCSKSYSTESRLKEHCDRVHKPKGSHTEKDQKTSKQKPQQRLYSCNVCHKAYMTAVHLREHIIRFHKPQKSQTEKAEESDSTVETPTKPREKPYACDVCDKRYYKGSHLKEHQMRVHGYASTPTSKKHQSSSLSNVDQVQTPTKQVMKSSNVPAHRGMGSGEKVLQHHPNKFKLDQSKRPISDNTEGKSREERLKELVMKKNKPVSSHQMKSVNSSILHKDKTKAVTLVKREKFTPTVANVQSAKVKSISSKEHGHSSHSVKRSLGASTEGHIHKKVKTSRPSEGSNRASPGTIQIHSVTKVKSGGPIKQSQEHSRSPSTPATYTGHGQSMHKDHGKFSKLSHSSEKSKPSLHAKGHSSQKVRSSEEHRHSLPRVKLNLSKEGQKVKTSHSLQKSSHSGSAQMSGLHKGQIKQSQAVYACHICEKTFSLRANLAIHLQNH